MGFSQLNHFLVDVALFAPCLEAFHAKEVCALMQDSAVFQSAGFRFDPSSVGKLSDFYH